MTKPAGSVTVTGYVAPSDENDTYASHSEEWGRGGWRTAADITGTGGDVKIGDQVVPYTDLASSGDYAVNLATGSAVRKQ